jgi:hypothetical protein
VIFAAVRFLRLAIRHRRLIALLLTVVVGIWERNRHRLPERLQVYEPPQRFARRS